MSLICRPTAGCLDLVQRIFEGLVNTPDAIFDSCQLEDFRQRQAVVGSELWWERVADPQGAAVSQPRFVQASYSNCTNTNPLVVVAGNGLRCTRCRWQRFFCEQEC